MIKKDKQVIKLALMIGVGSLMSSSAALAAIFGVRVKVMNARSRK